ncbi:MAG: glycosyltransferase family 2 protein [Pseudomonadota bacterium]
MTRPLDICICTYRRADPLAAALASLGRQTGAFPGFRVIVVDNDDTPSARPVALAARKAGLALHYAHHPGANVSRARNRALDLADGDWIAFFDDDQAADPGWLSALWAARNGADAVLGPVEATYAAHHPAWMRRHAPHSTRAVERRGRIMTGYSGNVLFHRNAAAFLDLRFLEALGRSGGEDHEFFDMAARHGARIVFARSAIAREPVPEPRARFAWLWRRRLRVGRTHGDVRIDRGAARPVLFAKAGAKAALCLIVAAGFGAVNRGHAAMWALRGAVHLGAMGAALRPQALRLSRASGTGAGVLRAQDGCDTADLAPVGQGGAFSRRAKP